MMHLLVLLNWKILKNCKTKADQFGLITILLHKCPILMTESVIFITCNSHGIRSKKEQLLWFVLNYNIHEAWLKSKFYLFGRQNRENSSDGGIAILVKKDMKYQCIDPSKMNFMEVIGIKIFLRNNQCIHIYLCYFSGGLDSCNLITDRTFKMDIYKWTGYDNHHIIGGDLNCSHNLLGCQPVNSWGRLLYEVVHVDHMQVMCSANYTYILNDASSHPVNLEISSYLNISSNLSSVKILNIWIWVIFPLYVRLIWPFRCLRSCSSTLTLRKSFPTYIVYLIQIRNIFRRNWNRFSKLQAIGLF